MAGTDTTSQAAWAYVIYGAEADDFIVGTSVADIIDSKEDNDVNHGDSIFDDGFGDEVILGGEKVTSILNKPSLMIVVQEMT
jgi:hypothetical protein